MKLDYVKLRVMGYVAANTDKKGWCHDGSQRIAGRLELPAEDVKVALLQLIHDALLVTQNPEPGAKVIPIKLTEEANVLRIRAFEQMFPDIKKALLTIR